MLAPTSLLSGSVSESLWLSLRRLSYSTSACRIAGRNPISRIQFGDFGLHPRPEANFPLAGNVPSLRSRADSILGHATVILTIAIWELAKMALV